MKLNQSVQDDDDDGARWSVSSEVTTHRGEEEKELNQKTSPRTIREGEK